VALACPESAREIGLDHGREHCMGRLEGHEESLGWRDFMGTPPDPPPAGEAAYTEARFDLSYGYEYDTNTATKGYQITDVSVKVTVERGNMWSVKSGRTDALLKHEQGHYDIVALLARDLYDELTGWNEGKKPKRFVKATDLSGTANRMRRSTEAQVVHLGGSPRSVGVYDKQTKHGLDAKAQEKWDAALADARTNGTRVTKALGRLGA
jgi:hypothetical protein